MKRRKKDACRDINNGVMEVYRMLQTSIDSVIQDKKLKVIVFTGVAEENGKSKHICNIARAMAEEGKKVLLIDCNIKEPKIHQWLQIPNITGLSTAKTALEYEEAVFPFLEIPRFHILTAGPKLEDTQLTLDIKEIEKYLKKIGDMYELILMDAPALGQAVEGYRLSAIADGTILVMTAGKTHMEKAVRAKEMLEMVRANVLGVILEK